MKPWKIQKFGSDLVYDLRSRGLLPLAVILVIAIVAVPFLVTRMSSSDPAPAPGQATQSATVKPAPEGQSAVVTYSSPGLRKSDRLDARSSKDPFVQQFPAIDNTATTSSSGSAEGGTGTSGGGTTGGSDTVTITGTTKSKLYYFYYDTDVRAGESGTELKRTNRVDPFTLLPSQEIPVVVFLGVASGGKQAVFSVSRQVTGVSGQGTCYPDPESCELLGIASGGGADLVYAGDGKTYRIEVARIKFVKSTKPPG
jgi:hypothetical protein